MVHLIREGMAENHRRTWEIMMIKIKRKLKSDRRLVAVWSVVVGAAFLGLAALVSPASPAGLNQSSAAQKPAPAKRGNDPQKTEIFRDAGLGLFIHWGMNSQMGTEISWPLYHASDDFIEKYYALAKTFNPVKFDPAEWARLAKLAGMEYVVFTAKHHDGYCMYDTAYSDFKVTNGPYGRDISLMVAEAFRKEGILAGFYYSPGDFRYQYLTGIRERELYEPNFAAAARAVPVSPPHCRSRSSTRTLALACG